MKKILTLCLIHNDSHVLLGMKKRGFGKGKWNGFGGKVERDEDVHEAAKREVFEEAGVTLESVARVGILHFTFPNDPIVLEVHVFRGIEYKGEPRESEEMLPRWFSIDEIPFENMWPDDKHWLPLFLSGKKFKGNFSFGEDNAIVEQYLEVVETL